MYRERNERLQIMLTQDELKAIDDWRFKRRMPSRASAIRELLRLGLRTEGVEWAEPHEKSRDFGVLNRDSEAGE
jgi:Arc/MetJ-type ribon-helix-helix transcriptional regulator